MKIFLHLAVGVLCASSLGLHAAANRIYLYKNDLKPKRTIYVKAYDRNDKFCKKIKLDKNKNSVTLYSHDVCGSNKPIKTIIVTEEDGKGAFGILPKPRDRQQKFYIVGDRRAMKAISNQKKELITEKRNNLIYYREPR